MSYIKNVKRSLLDYDFTSLNNVFQLKTWEKFSINLTKH